MSSPQNRTILQAFEWHTPSQPPANHETHSPQSHYHRLTRLLPTFVNLGFSAIWLPPGCKANNPHGNGYDCYDLWDLGEFDQKFSRATKWGSREELRDLIGAAHHLGLEVIWDAVLNHKAGGDGTEETWAVEVDEEDRLIDLCDPKKIRAWLRFDFDGRVGPDSHLKYSSMKWRSEHFNGVDWDDNARRNAIYKLVDDPSQSKSGQLVKGWAQDVDDENGNADYLMLSNIDYTHPEVRQDVINWGRWMIEEVGVDGFRLDAAQHFSFAFTHSWIQHVSEARRKSLENSHDAFVVGEIWTGDVRRIIRWLDAVGNHVHAFDSPLVYNFSSFSEDVRLGAGDADLRNLLYGTLLDSRPDQAITLVTNHDTQRGQTSYTPIDSDLKALFYAFILLRREGYPSVFWGDLYGTQGPHAEPPACCVGRGEALRHFVLPDLIMARKAWAYGNQEDYFDQADCIGWTRAGDDGHDGCAVIVSVSVEKLRMDDDIEYASKTMRVGLPGEVWVDILSHEKDRERVNIDDLGEGLFRCRKSSVAVFVKDGTMARSFPTEFDTDVYK